MLLLPEEGTVDGGFGARVEREFIEQREVTLLMQNHRSGTDSYGVFFACINDEHGGRRQQYCRKWTHGNDHEMNRDRPARCQIKRDTRLPWGDTSARENEDDSCGPDPDSLTARVALFMREKDSKHVAQLGPAHRILLALASIQPFALKICGSNQLDGPQDRCLCVFEKSILMRSLSCVPLGTYLDSSLLPVSLSR